MASGSTVVDVSNLPDVLRLAEEGRVSGKP